MTVGVCQIKLTIPGNRSLKGKRSVIKRIIERSRHKFNIAIAEVDDQEMWNHAIVGFCVVGNEARFLNSMIDKIVNFIENLHIAVVEDHSMEIFTW